MPQSIIALTEALARNAEAVCRHYLPNGRREGCYWMIGDVRGTPGRSMFVRLKGSHSGKGAAGKWTDAATGEYGDLLDIIRESCGLIDFKDVAQEARRFLILPQPEPSNDPKPRPASGSTGSPEAAPRLVAMSQPIAGTLAETYLHNRGITALFETGSLRFHPRCYYRPDSSAETETWSALIAAVTDLNGTITGAHHTWLDPNGFSETNLGRTPIDTHAARRATCSAMLSLKMVLPNLPMAAALSAAHLAAILFPASLRRLYIARDNDPAGDGAMEILIDRAREAGIEAIPLSPQLEDFNEDLRLLGIDALRNAIRVQIAPADVARFMDGVALAGRKSVSG